MYRVFWVHIYLVVTAVRKRYPKSCHIFYEIWFSSTKVIIEPFQSDYCCRCLGIYLIYVWTEGLIVDCMLTCLGQVF